MSIIRFSENETYKKALEYVRMQMQNGRAGERDLAYYVQIAWGQTDGMDEDIETMEGDK
jgi:hypothetical protein|tara:strand:- start:193 stop:369 length:177 start_codon:yes stop_codon:yes gene_type:complete